MHPKNKMKTYCGECDVISAEKYRGILTTQEALSKSSGDTPSDKNKEF